MKIRPTASAPTGSPLSPRRAMLKPLIGRPIEPCLNDAGGRVQRRQPDLGHAIALDDREAGGGGGLVQQLGRDLVRSAAADTQRVEVVRLQVVVADQRQQRRRDHRQHRRALLAQQRQQLVAVEGPRHHHPAGDREHAERPEEGADVGHRGARQEDVIAIELEGRGGAGDHPAQGRAGVGDALGRAGAAGGEEDRRGVGRVRGRVLGQRLALQQRVEVPRPLQADRQLPGEAALPHVLAPLLVGQQRLRAADRECVVDLTVGVAVVQRRSDQTRLEAGEVVDEQVEPVRHQRSDPVPRLQTQPPVAAGKPLGLLLQLAPAHRSHCRDQRHLVGLRVEPDPEQVVQRRGGSLQR
jgi:hypothetical protein